MPGVGKVDVRCHDVAQAEALRRQSRLDVLQGAAGLGGDVRRERAVLQSELAGQIQELGVGHRRCLFAGVECSGIGGLQCGQQDEAGEHEIILVSRSGDCLRLVWTTA